MLRMISDMKNGTPISAVRTPIGISVGENKVLAAVSHNKRNIAPASAETGINLLWLGPVIKRTAWGMINPTNPIVPQKQTLTAVIIEAISKSIFFRSPALMPRDTAVSSPVESIFRLFEFNKRIMVPKIIKGSITVTVCQLEPVMLPIVQKMMRWACSLEAMIIREIIDEHKKPIAIPDKINVFVTSLPPFWAIRYTIVVAAIAPIKAYRGTRPRLNRVAWVPVTKAIAAPRTAPDDIPRTYGSAMGLRNIP